MKAVFLRHRVLVADIHAVHECRFEIGIPVGDVQWITYVDHGRDLIHGWLIGISGVGETEVFLSRPEIVELCIGGVVGHALCDVADERIANIGLPF